MVWQLSSRVANGKQKSWPCMDGKSTSGTGVCRKKATKPSAQSTEEHQSFRLSRSLSSRPGSQGHVLKAFASANQRWLQADELAPIDPGTLVVVAGRGTSCIFRRQRQRAIQYEQTRVTEHPIDVWHRLGTEREALPSHRSIARGFGW